MKKLSITALRRVTIICAVLAIASVPLGNNLRKTADDQATGLALTQSSLARSQGDAASIAGELDRAQATAAEAQSLEKVYPLTLQYIRAQSATRLVTIQNVEVGSRQIEAKGVPLVQLSQPLAVAGNLKRVRVQVKFRYESLEELHRYLDGLQPFQAVLRSLEIVKDTGTAELLVLGV